MNQGYYAIGAEYKGGFFTPGTVLDEMNVLKNQMGVLKIEVVASNAPDRFKTTFKKFAAEYEKFYQRNSGWWDRTKNKTYALVLEYKERFAQWKAAFLAKGGKSDIKIARPEKIDLGHL